MTRPSFSRMGEKDLAALGRMAAVLFVASALRLGFGARPPDPLPAAGTDRVEEMLEATALRIEEVERRSRPLEEGERVAINRASEEELDRLPGVGPTLARAILDEREAHGTFATLEALTRVKGIGARTAERLAPHVDFRGGGPRAPAGPRASSETRALVSLSSASREELESLPGIGPALAQRILEARRDRPFHAVDDLKRVPGIGDATVARLRGHLRPR